MSNKTTETDRKATATDVAKLAGVSKWTVSRAFTPSASISERSREKVLSAASQLGYKPNLLARGLSKKQSNIIGLVVDNFENPHKLMMLNQVSLQLQQQGKTAMMLNISDPTNVSQMLTQADQFQVDGLIFLGTAITDELLQLARDIQHIPLVVLGRSSDIADINVVSTDDQLAGQQIAQLMLEQGYQRFAFISGPQSQSTWLGRFESFRHRLQEHQLDVEVHLAAGQYHRERGFAVMDEYLREVGSDHCQAVFCENDILAIGCMDAIKRHGCEIAVVGFDDIELANSESFQLTSYRQPLSKMVEQALQLIAQSQEGVNKTFAGELVLRRSHLPHSESKAPIVKE